MADDRFEKGMAIRTSILGEAHVARTEARKEEFALHIRAARNTGVSADEITEIQIQVAVYAGVPAANTAFAVAKAVFAAPGDSIAGEGNPQ